MLTWKIFSFYNFKPKYFEGFWFTSCSFFFSLSLSLQFPIQSLKGFGWLEAINMFLAQAHSRHKNHCCLLVVCIQPLLGTLKILDDSVIPSLLTHKTISKDVQCLPEEHYRHSTDSIKTDLAMERGFCFLTSLTSLLQQHDSASYPFPPDPVLEYHHPKLCLLKWKLH